MKIFTQNMKKGTFSTWFRNLCVGMALCAQVFLTSGAHAEIPQAIHAPYVFEFMQFFEGFLVDFEWDNTALDFQEQIEDLLANQNWVVKKAASLVFYERDESTGVVTEVPITQVIKNEVTEEYEVHNYATTVFNQDITVEGKTIFASDSPLEIEDSFLIGGGENGLERGRISMSHKEDDYFSNVNGDSDTFDALIIEKTDDDTEVEGGIVLGFSHSTVDDVTTPDEASGWATEHFPVLVLRGNGRAGIGTREPEALLHLQTRPGTNVDIQLQTGLKKPWRIYHDEETEDLRFWHDDASENEDLKNLFVLGKTGNIGIGTLTPTAKLEVVGDIRAQMYRGDENGNVVVQLGI